MRYIFNEPTKQLDITISNICTEASEIKKMFFDIWQNITEKVGIQISYNEALFELKHLVLYEALDGSRSTICPRKCEKWKLEGALFVINLIHILQSLGAKQCYIMIHTSYNRGRGAAEFSKILQAIEAGAPLIKKYGVENNVFCSCICSDENHELIELLKDVTKSTRNGNFSAYFLFNYSEEWAMSEQGKKTIENLPDIDVHIRHTKFQFSGGWIPGKMSRSIFLYSQNGSLYSNWTPCETITLIALSLLGKLIHKEEGLTKVYNNKEEITKRYDLREKYLFNKKITLEEKSKKLCILGSPIGVYQFYY